ncbi:Endopolyphosphatase [Drechslerella dactyloides]|uniref:Sphingomyelin phosphodiesterase n=1 Tax=Drechslerella dactyloides TaxID=74499 RepID=A0AAD6IWM2_DREDA|nr:Endopolyphosphatase [Drechslerella dactyloides]
MRVNASLLLAASLLASNASATALSAPLDSGAAPITPRKAFPDPNYEELEKRGVIDELVNKIVSEIESAVTCVGCQALTTALKGVAHLGDTVFVKVVTAVCSGLKVQDSDVCTGVVATEGPVIAKMLRSMTIGSRTNKVICSSLFGLCDAPDLLPYPGTIPPPAAKQKRTPLSTRSSAKPLKFVHISDTHIDRLYKNGTNTKCNKPICCRPYTPGDDVGKTQNPAGPFGSVGCDTPVTLQQSLYEAIKQTASDADFMIFTGDIIDAALWLQSEEDTVSGMRDMYTRISNSGVAKKVYGVMGNHDTAPVNLFPVSEPETSYGSALPYYNEMAANVEKWVGAKAAKSIKQNSGCYSVVHPGTNLKVISISTNFWYNMNIWAYADNGMDAARDPGNVFKWLTGELQSAEAAGQSAYIIGHMPPGIADALPDYSNYFNKVVTRYSSTIKGMFWGHTHSAEFEITYKDATSRGHQNAIITSYVTSCVTPRSANPVFRVYTVDPASYQILDYDHYYTSIADIAYGSTKKPEWKKLYSAKKVLGPVVNPPLPANAPLSPAFWHNLTVAFENNDGAFQAWFDRKIADFHTAENCDADCKQKEICQMRASSTELSCYKGSISGLVKRDLITSGAAIREVDEYLHRGPRTQHGTLQCGGHMLEVFMKMARDKESIRKIVATGVMGRPVL